MTMIARGYTTCRYGQMHYLAGTPDVVRAPTLVLLHQNPSSSQEYDPLVRELAQDRPVVAFDTPGYGMSDAPPAPLSMTEYAAAFAEAIDAMKLHGPIDVYGFHTGALLAFELAIARPDRIKRIAVTGIPMYDPDRRAALLQAALDTPAATEDGKALIAQMTALWDYVVGQRDPAVPLNRAIRTYADKNRALDRTHWAYRGVWSYDYARLGEIVQPTLLIQPNEALATVSRQAAALIPHSEILDLPELNRDIFEIGVPQMAAAMRGFFTP